MLSISNISLLASILIATTLAYVQREVISPQVLLTWYSFMVLASILRASQIISYQRHPSDEAVVIHTRLVRFRLVILISSLVWGAAGWLLFPENNPQHQVFLILMLAGMTAGGVISFSADLISALVFSVSIITPITIRLFVSGDRLLVILGMAVMLYLVFMIMSLRLINRNISDNITLRLEAIKHKELVRASEEHHRLLLNYSPVGIFHYNTDLIITYCNNHLADILQSTTKHIIELDMKLLNDQTLLPILRKAFDIQVVHHEGPFSSSLCNADLWLDLTCTASRDGSGNVTGGIGIVQDFTERKNSEARINSLAFYDPLTNLPNRRLLMNRLQQALASSSRIGRKGALLLIDLDNFKTLNDTLGHQVGDLLLQQVALRLTTCVREDDTISRLGGDEFVVILENLSQHALEAAAYTEIVGEKILAAINQPCQLVTNKHHYSCSIGAVLFNSNSQTTNELLKQADIAMYQAKKSGRNTLRFFDPEMQASITARAALEAELHKAIDKQQFQLHYQIQVDSTHRPLGAEALIRWAHPERGIISPAQFIPLAEETGLILHIGLWVLETACAQLKTWQQNPLTRDLILSVNISAKQLRQADFVAQVQAVVQYYAINPTLLKLELTESMLLENIEDTIVTMTTLTKIGIQFSMDDFGTGYSSLQYLKRLPLNQLKIDQSFVRDIATDNNDKVIVRTIIVMAQSLGISVIAEGVETEENRQFLLDNGCAHYQGYLFGRPLPIELFEASL